MLRLTQLKEITNRMFDAKPEDRVNVIRQALGVDDAFLAQHPEVAQSVANLEEAMATFNEKLKSFE